MQTTFSIIEKKRKGFYIFYSPFRFFISISLFSILLTYLLDEYIITNEVLYRSYSERYTYDKIQSLAETISKVEWIIYGITPLLYFFKFTLIGAILLVGDVLFEYKIGFKKLFQIAMIAEVVFLFRDLIKLMWFLFFEQAETLKHVGNFEVLSIFSLFKNQEIYSWLKYPFSIANLFELTYWLLLALGIKYVTGFDYNKSLKFVLSTYVVALLLWVTFVMFLSIM